MEVEKFSVGDNCYFVDHYNKIKFCEIKEVYEDEKELAYLVQELSDYKFITVPHIYCADSEAQLKGIKRK